MAAELASIDTRPHGVCLARGVARLLDALGYRVLTEFPLSNRRRADLIGLDRQGRFVIVEIKSSLADFRADGKWPEYRPWCDAFYFAVSAPSLMQVLPADVGVIVADAYEAALVRGAPEHPLAAARRKALMVRFGRTAAGRLLRIRGAGLAADVAPG
jgi:hypothetical protein